MTADPAIEANLNSLSMHQDLSQSVAVVLGAAGFVGRHASRALAARGCHVIGVGHGTWREEQWRSWGLSEWVASDITLRALDQAGADRPVSCVVHCAGSGAVSYSYASPYDDFSRATVTTATVLEWIRLQTKSKPRLVLVSSAAVYGDQGDTSAVETAVRSPISPYGFHKLSAELLCESYARFFSASVSVVRLFSVYGEGLRKQLLWDALSKFQSGGQQFFGTGNEVRDWIHVEDAANLLALAGLAPQSPFEIYNGGNEHATTRKVLTDLAAAFGYPKDVTFNGETHKGNPRRLTSDFGHTSRLLSWKPEISLDDGLQRYAAWFRSEAN